MSPLLEFNSVSVAFGERCVLSNISFSLETGRHTVVLGPNGAGKTTLLKAAAGLIPVRSGSITLRGRNVANMPRKRLAERISVVPQQLGFVFPHTVYDFVMMSRYSRQRFLASSHEDRLIVEEVLERADVSTLRDQSMDTLSGGECQRVLIASALASEPEALVLDEPSSYLDPRHQVKIRTLLESLVEDQGLTILSVTHDVNFANASAQRWLGLKGGDLSFDTSTKPRADQLAELYGIEFVEFVARDDGAAATLPGKIRQEPFVK